MLHAYLGIGLNGNFCLYCSTAPINPAGTRLEHGPQKRFPENVYRQAQNPSDPEAAIAGLISLNAFFAGQEHGNALLEFGKEAPRKRKKK